MACIAVGSRDRRQNCKFVALDSVTNIRGHCNYVLCILEHSKLCQREKKLQEKNYYFYLVYEPGGIRRSSNLLLGREDGFTSGRKQADLLHANPHLHQRSLTTLLCTLLKRQQHALPLLSGISYWTYLNSVAATAHPQVRSCKFVLGLLGPFIFFSLYHSCQTTGNLLSCSIFSRFS